MEPKNLSITLVEIKSKETKLASESNKDGVLDLKVHFNCYLENTRDKGQLTFFLLRDGINKIQGVKRSEIPSKSNTVGDRDEKLVSKIPVESYLKVTGLLKKTKFPIKSCSISSLEVEIENIEVISENKASLPFQLCDSVNSDILNHFRDSSYDSEPKSEILSDAIISEKNKGNTKQAKVKDKEENKILVGKAKKFDNRIFDLRSAENQAVFSIRSKILNLLRTFFLSKSFTEVNTPKLLSSPSESGASVFEVSYFSRKAYLAQSPQLYKQICLLSGMPRVFEVGPVFRAEDSNTHKHLTEYVSMDLEVRLENSVSEVYSLLWRALKHVFKEAQETCKDELCVLRKSFGESVGRVEMTEEPLVLEYSKAVELINERKNKEKEKGLEKELEILKLGDDIGSKEEKMLGEIVKEKFGSDVFVVAEYPFDIRAFYTKKKPEEKGKKDTYVKSFGFDIFVKGEEIISGAERENDYEKLIENVNQKIKSKKEVESLKFYLDAFKYGAPRHGGLGMGFDRVVSLFLGFKNIRNSVLFPRDPSRITP